MQKELRVLLSTHLPSAEEHTPANCSSRYDKGAGDASIESGAEQNELSSTLSKIFSRIRWVNYEQLSPLFRGGCGLSATSPDAR
jgi:hypothetical protein